MATKKQHIDDTLFCPRCFFPLKRGEGTRRYIDLIEHVSSPNSPASPKEYLICSNDDCLTRKEDDFWDWYGDFYCGNRYEKDFFYLDCNKAINSGSRRFSLQQKKKNILILHLIFFKAYIEITPLYNDLGTVRVKSSYKLMGATRTGFRNNWTLYISGIRMFFYCLREFDVNLKKYIEDPSNKYSASELMRALEAPSWDKRWWKLLSVWYNKRKLPGLKEMLCKTLK